MAASGSPESRLYKLIIAKTVKLDFLSGLRTMNIGSSSLSPGLDGVGRAAAALTVAALLAGYLPARRATRVNPVEALRYE